MPAVLNTKRCNHLPLGRCRRGLVTVVLLMLAAAPVRAVERANAPSAVQGRSAADLAARVDALILQLGSGKYIERSEAEGALLALGYDAFDQLKSAETSRDPEIAARARHLTRQLTVNWTREGDSPAVRQLLKGYARMSPDERYHVISRLAAVPSDESFAPLCRIARFDDSDMIAKRAALTLIGSTDAAEPDAPLERVNAIESAIGRSHRVSAEWLRTYALELQDPPGAVTAWQQHVDAELVELAGATSPLHRFVTIDLLQHVSRLHEKLGNDEELLALLLQMVELDEGGSADVLQRLVERLIRTKNWKAVDEIVDRYGDRFHQNPLLLYMLAEARREQGDIEESNKLADAAFKLSDASFLRMDVAGDLAERGLYDWAEREYREILVKEPAISNLAVLATNLLTHMLYDIQHHAEAASVLENYLAQWEEELAQHGDTVLDRVTLWTGEELKEQLDQFRARADYNRSCHARLQKDPVTERKYLEQAIQHSPRDIDVLIAMYRLPDDDAEFRSDVVRRIDEEAGRMEADLEQQPNNATLYNNWAWLIANTRGDYDKALRYAQRAVELANHESLPGFLDTLARACFATGDLEGALEHQRRAAELEPHTQQLQRQLEEFERAAAESQS